MCGRIASATPTSGERSQRVPSSVTGPGIGGERDDGDRDVGRDDRADGEEERPRQVDAGPLRLLGEVRDGLEPGEGEHRERDREQRASATVGAVPSEVPCVSACGEKRRTNPKTISTSCAITSSAGTMNPSA